jgi:hypothetical protein
MKTTATKRLVGWRGVSPAGRCGILAITRDGITTKYHARWQGHPLGLTVELVKLGQAAPKKYHVAIPKEGEAFCDHPEAFGEAACTQCKHIDALRAMMAAGRLRA